MPKKLIQRGIILATVFVAISLFYLTASATTVTVLDGQVSVTDSANSNTVSGDVVTIKAEGSLLSKKINTITITNVSGSTATISFDYSASTYSSFTIDSSAGSASGTFSKQLHANGSVTLVLVSNSGLSNRTATLTLSNFNIEVAADLSDVTIVYDSTLGSVAANGTTVNSGTLVEDVTSSGISLSASPKSGARFLGWINEETGESFSSATSYSFVSTKAEVTVKAVFVNASSSAWYLSGDTHLFNDWDDAMKHAASATTKTVVLMNDATLSNGEYTVPVGVTFLIPFDDNNTLCTTAPGKATTYKTPTAYRTLTLAHEANIIVNGAISLSANQYAASGGASNAGSPTGNVSFLKMETGSSIVVNSGASLSAYGYIQGSGSITANKGAHIYETFQFMDYLGGTQSTKGDMKDKKIFPMSQYYIQNIEVPLTCYAGALVYCSTAVNVSIVGVQQSTVKFIGSSGSMFNITSGYFIKDYDEATDRLICTVSGEMTIDSLEVKVSAATINSYEYILPINGNMTIEILSGDIVCNQHLAILPGTKVVIGEGATFTLGTVTIPVYNWYGGIDHYDSEPAELYVYDSDEWGGYCGTGSKKFIPVYVPNRTCNRTEADLVDAMLCVNGTLDASKGYLYTTNGGANICSTATGTVFMQYGSKTATYQHQYASQTDKYPSIPVVSAVLRHENGKYTTSLVSGAQTYGYAHYTCECDAAKGTDANGNPINEFAHGTWATAHTKTQATVAPNCTEGGYTTFKCSCRNEACVGDYKDALGHDEVIDAAKDATCTEPGLTEGKHCSVCEATIIAQNVIVALGHTKVTDVAVAPTCTTTGLTEGCHCSVCKEVLTAQEVVHALGHAWSTWVADNTAHTCTSTCDNDATHTITVLLEYRMDSYIWLNATVTSTAGTPTCTGMTLQAEKYLVQKVLSNHLTDSVMVSFTLNGTTPALDIGFPAYSALLKVGLKEDDPLYKLLVAMETYGTAADKYFDGVGTIPETVTKPDSSAAIQKPVAGSEHDKKGVGSLILNTTGATVFFDEALRLGVGYGFTGATVNADGTITVGNETYTVLQVGVLVKQLTSWTMCDALYADTASGALAYIVYNNSGATVTPGGSNNKPNDDVKLESPTFTNSLAESGLITFDLDVKQYKSPFALRTYAVVLDSNDAQHVIYGGQYVYGLGAYINNVFGTTDNDAGTDDKAFDWLLSAAAAYADAASEKYGG